MIEVTSRLRFTNYSLGDNRSKNLHKMLRDGSDRVIFLPTWWAALMRYAASVLNRHQQLAEKIDWDPVIDGTPKQYRRYFLPDRFALHEAFHPGAVVGVNAVLPTELSIGEFTQLLDVAGRYRGISHYRPRERWGTFEVVDVTRRRRSAESVEEVAQSVSANSNQ